MTLDTSGDMDAMPRQLRLRIEAQERLRQQLQRGEAAFARLEGPKYALKLIERMALKDLRWQIAWNDKEIERLAHEAGFVRRTVDGVTAWVQVDMERGSDG